MINVRDFGAVGDGLSDDTAAFQSAADSFGSGGDYGTANGGILYIPNGQYLLSDQTLFRQPGVRVVGEGREASKIKVASNLQSVFKWDQTLSHYSMVGVGIENIGIDMDGNAGHGVWMIKPYDGVTLRNVYVDNVADAYNGFRIEEDPDNTGDVVSQTAILENCIAIHKNNTATAALFYFDSLQEAVLIGCKGFGTYEVNGKAACHPFELEDCRGVAMLQCSAAFADRHGIKIFANDRLVSGISIDNCTFETIDGAVLASGNINGDVTNLRITNPRVEGNVAHAAGAIDLNKVRRSRIESMSMTLNLDSDCQRNTVESQDNTGVADNGSYNLVIGFPNAINNTLDFTKKVRALAFETTNTGLRIQDTDGSHSLVLRPVSNLSGDRTLSIRTGDASPTLDLASVSQNPIVTPQVGSFKSASCSLRYWVMGRIVFIKAEVSIYDAGNAGGAINLPLPFIATESAVFHGRETYVTGSSVNGSVNAGSANAIIMRHDFTSIIGSGRNIIVEGFLFS